MSLTDTGTNSTNDIRPLEERLAETVGLRSVVTAEGFGIRSPGHWVVVALRCVARPVPGGLVAAARTLDGLPHVGALFEAGSLSEDQLGPADGEHAPAGSVRQLVIVDLERDHRAVSGGRHLGARRSPEHDRTVDEPRS